MPLNNVIRLANYHVMNMPLSNVLKPNFYSSSMYSDDVRLIREELKALYCANGAAFGDQFATVLFLRDHTEQDRNVERYDELVVLSRRLVTETARVSPMAILDCIHDVPYGTQWITVLDWHDAILTCLYFVVDTQ